MSPCIMLDVWEHLPVPYLPPFPFPCPTPSISMHAIHIPPSCASRACGHGATKGGGCAKGIHMPCPLIATSPTLCMPPPLVHPLSQPPLVPPPPTPSLVPP